MSTESYISSLPVTEIIDHDPYCSVESWPMEFRLIYNGYLPPASNNEKRAEEKQAIRRIFHSQLRQLWEVDENLRTHARLRGRLQPHDGPELSGEALIQRGWNYLADDMCENGFRYIPLVMEKFCVACSLDILFLRIGQPGKLIQNGDIDNRLKVLFDALRKPKGKSELAGATPEAGEDPFFVLLEDDLLITEVKVTTDRLLQLRPQEKRSRFDVHLVIDVKLVPIAYNQERFLF